VKQCARGPRPPVHGSLRNSLVDFTIKTPAADVSNPKGVLLTAGSPLAVSDWSSLPEPVTLAEQSVIAEHV